VLRAEVGKSLRVGLLDGAIGTATVLAIADAHAELGVTLDTAPPTPRTDLLLAVPRPKSLKKVLPELAAFGIARLVLMRTWKVERPFLESPILEPAHYEPLLDEGLMQGMSTHRPRVSFEPRFKPFVEDRLPALLADRIALVAHPQASARLADLSLAPDSQVTIAIGPEGGFLPYEVDLLKVAGCLPVRLGERILRVETACVAALAQLDLLRQQGGVPVSEATDE
jgi:RsmE family RNA methyltransferase